MGKITLFIKPFIMKVCFPILLFIYIVIQPSHAYAGFFSDLIVKVLGTGGAQASEITPTTNDVVHNSQTLPLLESSINPDLKDIKDEPVALALSPSDAVVLASDGALDVSSNLEKNASSEKITTYTVKAGDTLEGISKQLNVPQSTIMSSNADLKKADLLKIGQNLVIIGVKADSSSNKVNSSNKTSNIAGKQSTPTIKQNEVAKTQAQDEPKSEPKDEGPSFTINTSLPSPSQILNNNQQVQGSPSEVQLQVGTNLPVLTNPTTPASSGQPSGSINGGYLWPFPKGVGRISQGLHADNAYDFAAPKNTPIYAVQNGTVLIVHPTGWNGGFGKYVVIDFTDGRQAIFAHMNQTVAEVGQVVKQGDIIGYVGTTGDSTGPHTHIGFHGPLGNPYISLKVNSTSEDFHD